MRLVVACDGACTWPRGPLSGAHFGPLLRAMRWGDCTPKFLGMANEKMHPKSKADRAARGGAREPATDPSPPPSSDALPEAADALVLTSRAAGCDPTPAPATAGMPEMSITASRAVK